MSARQYQSFTKGAGDSNSVEKLSRLFLPDLAGLSFLDVGCNEGFFCGYALSQGASQVVGIDCDPEFVVRARSLFAGATFIDRSWDELPVEKFDVILLASALHYAEDQPLLIHRLMDRVSNDGLLVLEAGIAPGSTDEWTAIERHDGTRLYATRSRMESVLKDYAFKLVGRSIDQAGDIVPRWVWHIRRKKPIAVILAGESYAGKSTLARMLRAHGMATIEIDARLLELFNNHGNIGPLVAHARYLRRRFDPLVDGDKITISIFESGLSDEFVRYLVGDTRAELVVVDGYIPAPFLPTFTKSLARQGFVTWLAHSEKSFSPATQTAREDQVYSIDDELYFIASNRVVRMHIDDLKLGPGTITVLGWAYAPNAGVAAVEIGAVSAGRRLHGATMKRVYRKDLYEIGWVLAGEQAGFELTVPIVRGESFDHLHVIARCDGRLVARKIVDLRLLKN